MILGIYAVNDSKAGNMAAPFFVINDNVAIRSFTFAANDPNLDLNRYPSDYVLYKLGEFDNETGSFDILPIPQNLGSAAQYLVNKGVIENAS